MQVFAGAGPYISAGAGQNLAEVGLKNPSRAGRAESAFLKILLRFLNMLSAPRPDVLINHISPQF